MVFSETQNIADTKSINAQKSYLRSVKWQLVLLFVTTLSSLFLSMYSKVGYVLLVFMVINFAVSLILKLRKPEKLWYDGRAVAESLKTLSWRYSMRSAPFDGSTEKEEEEKADRKFIESVIQVLEERKNVCNIPDKKEFITARMKEIRAKDLKERLSLYAKQRIKDQCDWYSSKSNFNSRRESLYFYISISLQFLAIAYLVLMLLVPQVQFNLIAIISSLATITLTWLQTKQHRELAQSYSIAAFELAKIAALKSDVTTEKEFSEYVNESENAISREHTLWTARRGQ